MDYEARESGILVPRHRLVVGGTFRGRLIRDGRVIDEFEQSNIVVNQGLDHILSTEFTGGQQITQWYLGLFANNYTPIGTDTAASIAANAGETQAYTGSGRVAYQGVESSQQVTNAAAPASFTFNAPVTVYGGFMISSSGFLATTGTLFAASQFGAPKQVVANDILLITYAFGATSA